ncbi:MAG: MarR family transcriptional regulator [Deltaproteobacteria bacterium]|nr:MarR family transcriptional regulator [Deltaproteobacteria bacterium]
MRALSDRDVLYSQALADRLGVSLTDFKASSLLAGNGPMPAGRLAELTGLTTGAVTGVLDRLEKAGWLRRLKDPGDRRHVLVESLQEPAPRIHELLEPLRQAMKEVTAGYDEAQLELVVEFVTRAAAIMAAETTRLRQDGAPASSSEGPDSAPIGDAKRGVFRLTSGASRLTLGGGADNDHLYQARFTGRRPEITVSGGTVHMSYPMFAFLDFRKVAAEVDLNSAVPWDIELTGGISKVRAALEDLRLTSLNVRGGASAVEIALPAPHGVVQVRITGGASHLQLTRPKGSAMRIQVHGGASHISFDDQHLGAVGGVTRLSSSGFESATDRYELELTGGASHLSIGVTG